MTTEFVPYELALKLKELGFNEECIAYYDLRNDLEFYGGDNLKDTHCVQLNTPLFQQAFRWFREKGFFVSFSTHDYNIHDFYIKWSIPDRSTLSESILSDAYDTFEETELACLNKLIEIEELNKL
jgi:hypothetical protein